MKDRAALSMILEGERSGKLKPGMTILGRDQRQHRHRLRDDRRLAWLPGQGLFSEECQPPRKRILRSYGVEIVETDPMLSTDGAQLHRARNLRQRS